MSRSKQNFQLMIQVTPLSEGGESQEHTFHRDVVRVGCGPASHLRLGGPGVSDMHAVIEVNNPETVAVNDLGSVTGIQFRGEAVRQATLAVGESVQIGDHRIEVLSIAPSNVSMRPSAAPPAGSSTAPSAAPGPSALAVPAPAFAIPGQPAVPTFGTPGASPTGGFTGGPMAGSGRSSFMPPHMGAAMGAGMGTGPVADPSLAELDAADGSAIEVRVRWGDDAVLQVSHLSPPRPFVVGDVQEGEKLDPPDFLLGSETLGFPRWPLVVEHGAGHAVVVPQGAQGDVQTQGQLFSIAQLQQSGAAVATSELPGAVAVGITQGTIITVRLGGFVFEVKSVAAARPFIGGSTIDWRPVPFLLGSAGLFGLMLLFFALSPPRSSSLSLDLIDDESLILDFLVRAEEKEKERIFTQGPTGESGGEEGERHEGDEGEMGKEETPNTKKRYGIKGPEDNADPHMAKERAIAQAKTAGILGILQNTLGDMGPTSPFGRDTALGRDSLSALGNLVGGEIGESGGFGGLALSGSGRGGGGTGEGTVGMGSVGTLGRGGRGQGGTGFGSGRGGLGGRGASVPVVRQGVATTVGSLSKEVIRRVVRRHINEVSFCYEQRLAKRPDLEGRVTINFIISQSGAVQSSQVKESTLGDGQAESCIAQAVRRWTFPAPEGGGIVVVNYPFLLNPVDH